MEPEADFLEQPLSPYRVIRDLMQTVDVSNTIITHDSGSPRTNSPLSGNASALFPTSVGANRPNSATDWVWPWAPSWPVRTSCASMFWGDAAIGFTGTDLETAVRERIPILSILFNNFCMAAELQFFPTATERHRVTDISGNYAEMARSLGCYGERIEKADEIVPALKRGIQKTREGVPVLLEFMTLQETDMSVFHRIGVRPASF